jgi:hypothetical protein
MDKQELLRFLQDEADRALVDLFPQILKYLEARYSVGSTVEIVLVETDSCQENIKATIAGTAALKLEELGYNVSSYINEHGQVCLGVS